jgi:hypothetical protein
VPRAESGILVCDGCGREGHTAEQCYFRRHPNWKSQHATVKWKESAIAKEIRKLAIGNLRFLPPDGVQLLPEDNLWTGGEKLKAWKAKMASSTIQSHNTSYRPDQHKGKQFHLGVIRGGTDVYPSLQETITSMSMESTTKHIVVACLLDTGCLFANFIKADIARRLGTNPHSADKRRLVTLADGSIISSVGFVLCDVTLKHDETPMRLKDVTLHILPGLTFNVILEFPCIRKYNLVNNSPFFSARATCRCTIALSVVSVCQRSSNRSAHRRMGRLSRRSCWRFLVWMR